MSGVTELADLPDVVDVRLDCGPGSRLDASQGGFGTVFTVDGLSPDHASIAAIVEAIVARARIETR